MDPRRKPGQRLSSRADSAATTPGRPPSTQSTRPPARPQRKLHFSRILPHFPMYNRF